MFRAEAFTSPVKNNPCGICTHIEIVYVGALVACSLN